MARIELAHVTKRWGDVVGVHDLTLTVGERELLVLLGPSGCGKTTTMRMIAGLEGVTEGEIRIGDRLVNDMAPKDRDVAMVFQNYGLYPNLDVYENIRFPLKVRKVPKDRHDSRVRHAAGLVELENLLTRKPAELSGGQRQRVALARAIVREPSAFLMDEPLSNLDAKLRVATRGQIKNLQHRLETATIYVTHDQIEAMTLAHRVVVMNHGVVQQIGSPAEIYDRPANTFVAGFIGSPAMNLLRGQVRGGTFESQAVRVAGLDVGDGPLQLGFRAEDAWIARSADEAAFHAPIYTVELIGESTMVTVDTGDAMVIVKAPKSFQAEIGDSVGVAVAAQDCHLFDAETGARVGAA